MPPTPLVLKKTVAFLYVEEESGVSKINGNGFFVGTKIQGQEEETIHFVTAKHVLQKRDEKGNLTDVLYPYIRFRLENEDGIATVTSRLPLIKDETVFLHDNSEVDIAVIPVAPNKYKYNYDIIPQGMIHEKGSLQEWKLQEGLEVFFIGLFLPHMGVKKNYPITRFGKIALISEEKILWDKRKRDLYLIECSSYGGNSGSPVFVYVEPKKKLQNYTVGVLYRLIGIVSGYFGESGRIGFRVVSDSGVSAIPYAVLNSGISAVVPAHKLLEILYSKEVKAYRKKTFGE